MVFNTGSALLDAIVLAIVSQDAQGTYGYKITQEIRAVIELSESTLYTILKRLENADMLTVRTAEHDGRLRKYYHITENGVKRIEEFKSDWKEIMSIYKFVTKGEENNDKE